MDAEATTNQPPSEAGSEHAAENAASGAATLHRICIQCNNVFCVAPEHFDAKHCPVCRKE